MPDVSMADAGAAAENLAPDESTQSPAVVQQEADATHDAEQQTDAKAGHGEDASLRRLQRRVDRVTAARYQAEAQARQEREMRQRLEAELQQYRGTQQQDQTPSVRPEDVERLADERAREIAAARDVDRRGTEITRELGKLAGSVDVGSVVQTVIDEAGPLLTPRGTWTPLGEAIAECEAPARVLHYLSQNPDTAAELSGLSASALGRKLARIESQIGEAKAPPPRPLRPVTSTAGASAPKAESAMTDAEWYEARRKR
jgi:hypothetical protein